MRTLRDYGVTRILGRCCCCPLLLLPIFFLLASAISQMESLFVVGPARPTTRLSFDTIITSYRSAHKEPIKMKVSSRRRQKKVRSMLVRRIFFFFHYFAIELGKHFAHSLVETLISLSRFLLPVAVALLSVSHFVTSILIGICKLATDVAASVRNSQHTQPETHARGRE